MAEALQYLRADGSCPFADRFMALPDVRAQARIDTAVRKLARGLKPDLRPVGEGVHEARIDYGPGYRIYFGNDGSNLVVLLLCGDKRTQRDDIVTAQAYWSDYKATKAANPLR